MASGFSALAAALVVGARKDYGRQALLPHNAVFVLLGAGLLWFGWFGFNGGSGLSTGDASVLAFVNTLLCPACALVTWFVLDLVARPPGHGHRRGHGDHRRLRRHHPRGRLHQPRLGDGCSACSSALPSYGVIVWRTRTRVDETLDVLAAHGIGGLRRDPVHRPRRPGVAGTAWPTASSTATPGSCCDQAVAALAAPALRLRGHLRPAAARSALVMPLRATEHEEALGMDVVFHGEEAYVSGEGAILITEIPEAQPSTA